MNYTIEQAEIEDFYYKTLLETMTIEIQKSIDNEIIWEMAIAEENGLYHIKLNNILSIKEIETWLAKNCKEYYIFNTQRKEFLFASDKELVLFKLRWA